MSLSQGEADYNKLIVITYNRFYLAGPTVYEFFTNSAVIRLFVVHSWTVFSTDHQHSLR